MSFRQLGFIISIAFALALAGCSLRVGEKPAQNAEIKLGDNVGCLSQIGVVFHQFFAGELESEKLEEFFACARMSLESFENYTVGEDKESYHPEEIRHFLQTYFLKDRTISDALLAQAMNLKVVVLGGDKSSVSREEFQWLIENLDLWKTELLVINRFMKVYNWNQSQKLQRQYPKHMVDAAFVALRSSLLSILGTFKGGAVQYDSNNIETLIREFRAFSRAQEVDPNVPLRPVEDWTLLIQAFKRVAMAHRHPELSLSDLNPLIQETVDWLSLVAKYQYFVKGENWLVNPGLEALHGWIVELFQTIDRSMGRHEQTRMSYLDIHQFLLALERFMSFPFGITADYVRTFAPQLLNQMLRDRSAQTPRNDINFFSRRQWHVAYSIYSQWFEIQSHISNEYTPSPQVSAHSQVPGPLILNVDSSSGDAIRDLNKIIRSIPPLYRRGFDTIFLVEARKIFEHQLSHDSHNLTYMNVYRTLLLLAMRGYAKSFSPETPQRAKLSAQELQNLYLDLKPIGVELGLMDPRSENAGFRSFIEANLFTYISDGLDEPASMSFEEGMLFLSYLWSGSQLSHKIYTKLEQVCRHGPEDVRGQPKIDRPCVQRELFAIIQNEIATFPGLKTFLDSASSDVKLRYTQNLLASSISANSSDAWVERAELDVISMIIHYTESVVTRFNVDADSVLERDEINSAIPVFGAFIRQMAKSKCMDDLDQQRVEDVFRHIVETGEVPEKAGVWNNIGLWKEFRRRRGEKWNPQLDRGHMTEVFASIISKSITGVGGKKTCPE